MANNDKAGMSRPPVGSRAGFTFFPVTQDMEMNRIQGVLDRLFEDYWQGATRRRAVSSLQAQGRMSAEAEPGTRPGEGNSGESAAADRA
jgi:hypothetical protein